MASCAPRRPLRTMQRPYIGSSHRFLTESSVANQPFSSGPLRTFHSAYGRSARSRQSLSCQDQTKATKPGIAATIGHTAVATASASFSHSIPSVHFAMWCCNLDMSMRRDGRQAGFRQPVCRSLSFRPGAPSSRRRAVRRGGKQRASYPRGCRLGAVRSFVLRFACGPP